MKRSSIIAAFCVGCAAGIASAQEEIVQLRPSIGFSGIGVRLGRVDPEWASPAFTFGGGVGLGSLFHHRVDFAAEVNYWSAGDIRVKSGPELGGDLSDFSIGSNLSFDLFEFRHVSPFVLAGISAHKIGADIASDRELEDALDGFEVGLDLGTGLAYRTRNGWRFGAESRWVIASDVGNWSLTATAGWWPHREPKREVRAPAVAVVSSGGSPQWQRLESGPVATNPVVVEVPGPSNAVEVVLLQGMVRDLLDENRRLQAELEKSRSAWSRERAAVDARAETTSSELESQQAELKRALEEVAGLSGQMDALRETQDGLLLSMKASLLFPIGSSKLQVGALEELRRIASVLFRFPEVTMVVEGHTDSKGDAGFNLHLSEQRARAVERELMRLGVAEDKIQAIGFGADHPLADNATADGRARNRRVEIRLRQPGSMP